MTSPSSPGAPSRPRWRPDWRVVLVVATDGDQGSRPLTPGTDLGWHRRAEVRGGRFHPRDRAGRVPRITATPATSACPLQEVRRPVVSCRGRLAAAHLDGVAVAVRTILVEEGATALTSYDANGIYGHIDHVQVHEIGTRSVAGTDCEHYEATLDRGELRRMRQRPGRTGHRRLAVDVGADRADRRSTRAPTSSGWTWRGTCRSNWPRWRPTRVRCSRRRRSWGSRPGRSITSSARSGSGWHAAGSGRFLDLVGPGGSGGRQECGSWPRRPDDGRRGRWSAVAADDAQAERGIERPAADRRLDPPHLAAQAEAPVVRRRRRRGTG